MRHLIVFALILSSTAFAGEFAKKKISFSPRTYSGNGTQTYYNCDSVEQMAESHLAALGATNIRVYCSGGFGHGNPWPTPAYVSGTFDAPVPTSGGAPVAVELKGWDSCDLNSEFLDYVIPMFSGVKVVRRSANCMGGHMDRWSYLLDVTL
jgi:hypothetical protein